MHVPLLLVVAGVLIAALLVLLLSLYLLESHVDQNGMHLKRFKQGFHKVSSSPNHQNSHQPQVCPSRGAKAEPQICCICGSAKNRHQHEATASPLIADSMWSNSSACGSSVSASAQLLECLSRLADSCGESGSLFHERGNRSSSGVDEDEKSSQDRFHAAAASVPFVISSSAASLLSTIANTGYSRSKPESLASISTSLSSTSSSDPAASQNVDIKDRKQIPQRRLVLEILMSSPSQARIGQEQTLPCHAGLRLKVETNATPDSPLNDSHVEANDSVQQGAKNHQKPVLINNLTKASPSASSASVDDRILIDKHVSLLPNADGKSCNNPCCNEPGPSAAVKNAAYLEQESYYSIAVSDCGGELKNGSAYDYGEGRTLSSTSAITPCSSSTKKITGYCSLSSGQFTATACEAVAQSTPVPLCSNGDQITTLDSCINLISGGSDSSDLSQKLFSLEKCLHEKSCWCLNKQDLRSARTSSLDGLGCLKLTSLETGARSFCMKDITKEVDADVASALAALTVDTGSRMDLGSGLSEIKPPEPKERISFEHSSGIAYNYSHMEKAKQQGFDCEQRTEEQDEHQQASMDKREGQEDHVDGGKSEKRKKKNRGRKQKGKASVQTEALEGSKTAALAAMCGKIEEIAKLKSRASVDALRSQSVTEVEVGCICGVARGGLHSTSCPYPFTSSGSMVQRKIKEQYDDLVRSNAAKRLTLAQVGRFTTCLVETKASLQQKSETIQRRFTITKSLLAKADKSCFDRLCGQVYALEVEHKKLEEDTIVYNRLQEQLKQSPAYQKMLEYGRRHFELQPNTGQLIEKASEEGVEISFEELLAKEKKDSFWQKHGHPRSSSVQVR